VGALALSTCVAGGVSGCHKKDADDKAQAEKAEADRRHKPQGDRYADGQRLAAALKDWTRRWSETQDLPACDPLLKDAADLELCKTAATKIMTGMRKHSMLTRYVGALVSICFFFLLTGRACYIAAILVDVEFRPDNLPIIAGF